MSRTGTPLCLLVILSVINATGAVTKTACFQPPLTPVPTIGETTEFHPEQAPPGIKESPVHTKMSHAEIMELFKNRGFIQPNEQYETPNPIQKKPGYIESEEEEEEEEEEESEEEEEEEEEGGFEWDRKRRQATAITGIASCDIGKLEKMRIVNVTVGYSHDGVCESRRPRCRRDATHDPQVERCDGSSSCELNYPMTTFGECPLPINFVNVEYECLPEEATFSICDWADAGKTGPVTVISPGYPGPSSKSAGTFLTCECVLTTDTASAISMTSLRSVMSGNMSSCVEDMLLVEKKDPQTPNKFSVTEEICGKVRREEKALGTSVVRMTYLHKVSAGPEFAGFHSVFRASSLATPTIPSILSVRCRDLTLGPQAGPVGDLPAVSSGPSAKANPIPPTEKTALGTAAGAGAIMGEGTQEEGQDSTADANSGGMMSAVVASLASIIVIMGSVTAYFLYRRSQRKKMQKFQQQQSVRSAGTDVSWYNDPLYVDPSYQAEKSSRISQSEKPTQKTLVDSATYTSDQTMLPKKSAPLPPPPPPRPTAPPRRKKADEAAGDAVYDNNDGKEDEVYLSISDVYDNA